jgi:hypothetical protein
MIDLRRAILLELTKGIPVYSEAQTMPSRTLAERTQS